MQTCIEIKRHVINTYKKHMHRLKYYNNKYGFEL